VARRLSSISVGSDLVPVAPSTRRKKIADWLPVPDSIEP
jgi:hypothetical protein